MSEEVSRLVNLVPRTVQATLGRMPVGLAISTASFITTAPRPDFDRLKIDGFGAHTQKVSPVWPSSPALILRERKNINLILLF
jgi:hypothetical protein